VQPCEEEQNISGSGCSVAALEEVQQFGWFGVLQCLQEFRSGGGIVAVPNGDKFGWEFLKEQCEGAVEWLKAVWSGCHDSRFCGAKRSEAVSEGGDIATVDGFAELFKFAKCGAIGGQSLEVIGGL
jgi:hypothetical protein